MRTALKVLLGIIIIFLLVFFGFQGYQEYLAPLPPTSTPAPVFIEQEASPQVISAEGKVVPNHYANLSFEAAGLVDSVQVAEGDIVQEGSLIASLKGREQIEASLAAAELDLVTAEQTLDEIIQLAPLRTAQAQQDLANAMDNLEDVEKRWKNSQEGNRNNSETIASLEEQLKQADEMVKRAEQEFAKYAGRPETDPLRQLAASALLSAQRIRNRLQGQLNWYQTSPSTTDQAILDAELALAEERLAEAQRQWENKKDGPDKNQLVLAQAQLDRAKAQLEAVQALLNNLELRAPFTGKIVSLGLAAGEAVAPTVPVVVLADISEWQVETIDFTENDFALVKPGMDVIITLTAYPGQEFRGIVRKIGLLGEDRRGSVTYPLTIVFDPGEAVIQWGMTAFVDIPLP
jgi:multidrug efflux pump subunit AcrA (membrane-fusion protein)